MPRRMSFALTTRQVRNRTKTVTRRVGWAFLRPGDVLIACEKCMGLGKGGHPVDIGRIRVVSVREEPLAAIHDEGMDGPAREGFPGWTPEQFVEFFCEEMGGQPEQTVRRIEFEYMDDEATP